MEKCECSEPGFCKKFNKEMTKRMYEICNVINTSLELSEKYKELWLREKNINRTEKKDCGCKK